MKQSIKLLTVALVIMGFGVQTASAQVKRGTAAAMKASADGSTHDIYLITTNK